MTVSESPSPAAGGRVPAPSHRWAEFAVLYVAMPTAHAVFFDTLGTVLPLAVMVVAGSALLAWSPGFAWRSLIGLRGVRAELPVAAAFLALASAVIFAATLLLVPERLFDLPRTVPRLWLAILVLYPIGSVFPQELLYRALFFHRYADLFGGRRRAITANALVYALAHAFYQNWVALILPFAGGLVFAWVYVRTGSFPLVFALHAVAGQLVFTIGLGIFFYHGAIQ